MVKVVVFVTSFFFLSFSYGQKIYLGWGFSYNLANNIKTDFQYLSESEFFLKPWKVKKQSQFTSPDDFIGSVKLEFGGGVQLKQTFLEFNLAPYYVRTFTIKASAAPSFGGSTKESKFIYNFMGSDFSVRLKQILTGRSSVRIAAVIGLTNMYIYNKSTKIGSSKVDFDLFTFERKFYQFIMFGVEYIGNNGQDNVAWGLWYEQQLTKFSQEIRNGYLSLGCKFFIYKKRVKREIYEQK